MSCSHYRFSQHIKERMKDLLIKNYSSITSDEISRNIDRLQLFQWTENPRHVTIRFIVHNMVPRELNEVFKLYITTVKQRITLNKELENHVVKIHERF